MFICVTEIDAVTNIICTEAPQRNGPIMPRVKGLKILWANSSTWPVPVNTDGTYSIAPLYYGTCDDDADINITGVLEILTEEEFTNRKNLEIQARPRPFPSWYWDESLNRFRAPVLLPSDAVINGGNVRYRWNETVLNWEPRE